MRTKWRKKRKEEPEKTDNGSFALKAVVVIAETERKLVSAFGAASA